MELKTAKYKSKLCIFGERMAENKILAGVLAFIAIYIAFRIVFYLLSARESGYEKQLKKIMISGKYKVKGRHD